MGVGLLQGPPEFSRYILLLAYICAQRIFVGNLGQIQYEFTAQLLNLFSHQIGSILALSFIDYDLSSKVHLTY